MKLLPSSPRYPALASLIGKLSLALLCTLPLHALSMGNAPAAEQQAMPIPAKRGHARDIAPDFLGFNGNLVGLQRPWSDTKLLTAFKNLNPGNLRYPGGTVANYWDWDKGQISDKLSASDVGPSAGLLEGRTKTHYPLEELALATQTAGATPIFVLNMILYDVDEQIVHLKKAQGLGMPIKYVELGNEFYFGSGAHPIVTQKYKTAEDYAKAAAHWSRTLKSAFPGVEVAVIGAGPIKDITKSSRRRTWDKKLFSAYAEHDAVTLHLYPSTGLSEAGRDEENSGWGPPHLQHHQAAQINTQAGFETMLETAWQALENKFDDLAIPKNAKVWITEFNIWDSTGAVRGTWAHGLAVASFINEMLKQPRISLASYHNVYAQSYFTAIWRYPNEYKRSVINPAMALEKYQLSGAGVALSLISEAARGAKRATPLQFTLVPTDGPSKLIFGWEFAADGNKAILLANLTQAPVTVELPEETQPAILAVIHSTAPNKLIRNTDDIMTTQAKTNKNLNLPAHSLTVLR